MAEPAAPSAEEVKYQAELAKLLEGCAHRGAAEGDYRLGLEEALAAAKACPAPEPPAAKA